ncbi:hypothetical protein E4H12_01005 [Candidatus Thorarchaeota archaeon]|nr:MAG: hypothetical protein E4H12_01005 [Candidatus Thorarchaeota archaeon]
MGRSRFIIPIIFAILGIAITILSIYQVTIDQASVDFFPFIAGTLYTDIVFVLSAAIPIIALEYFIIAIPLAVLFLIGNSFIKAAAYETNIMKIGESFGGIRMVRRAAAPALFSVSTAGIVRGFFEGLLVVPLGTPDLLYRLSGTLMASLVIMPIALALFMPTWILNDAGIVNHLRKGQLDVRQCPHTEGVGRWYSSMLGGYSILAFPIAMFSEHFFKPYIIGSETPALEPIFISLVWTIGIPLLIMTFIVPVILLNEFAGTKAGGFVQGFVKRMGADVVEKPRISRVAIEKPPKDEISEG